MELDELKSLWEEQDKKLEANLKLNEDLLKKRNLDRSKGELQKPMIYEIFNSTMLVVLLIVFGSFIFKEKDNAYQLIAGLCSVLLSVMYLVFSMSKIAAFQKVDCYHLSVVQLQMRLEKLKRVILRYRKVELILTPLFIVVILPVFSKLLTGVDVFQKINSLVAPFVVGLLVAIPVMIYINRNLYDKKLENTRRFLAEIEELEK
ncbi:hypothetical protein [Marinifilum caeruleilacunae]|uniref:Uncharacterized protein n=1 Tax=Marinifilum caeruleilacunae TaxID=2499076 RepID=A0ABX1WW33_9BACT|nr:hypothetical protein [Marinifilum caeruleilacunae]NOU60312.1 hypothetical protein [Marinifilum caeruleilacunae]